MSLVREETGATLSPILLLGATTSSARPQLLRQPLCQNRVALPPSPSWLILRESPASSRHKRRTSLGLLELGGKSPSLSYTRGVRCNVQDPPATSLPQPGTNQEETQSAAWEVRSQALQADFGLRSQWPQKPSPSCPSHSRGSSRPWISQPRSGPGTSATPIVSASVPANQRSHLWDIGGPSPADSPSRRLSADPSLTQALARPWNSPDSFIFNFIP